MEIRIHRIKFTQKAYLIQKTKLKRLYIISGCNGAGKTTASYTILPEILECDEFVNADEIAKGLAPFNPDAASLQAGRLMLLKIHKLFSLGKDFAIETTLATRSHRNLVNKAHNLGYKVTLLFFWLRNPDLAIKRVKIRVLEGGHNIPEEVIRRRYQNGLRNFFTIFLGIVDEWIFIDNSGSPYETLAQMVNNEVTIYKAEIWSKLQTNYLTGPYDR